MQQVSCRCGLVCVLDVDSSPQVVLLLLLYVMYCLCVCCV